LVLSASRVGQPPPLPDRQAIAITTVSIAIDIATTTIPSSIEQQQQQ